MIIIFIGLNYFSLILPAYQTSLLRHSLCGMTYYVFLSLLKFC